MRKVYLTLALIVFWLPTILKADEQEVVMVAAASSLRPALEEIKLKFESTHSLIVMRTTYGASGTLAAQILNGAPYDLFLSADTEYPAKIGEGFSRKIFLYANGRLAFVVSKAFQKEESLLEVSVVKDSRIKKIALANPEHAPYGALAVEVLKKAGLYDAIKEKIVYGENVGQVAHFFQTEAVDVGFLPLSFVMTGPLKEKVQFILVPEEVASVSHGGVALNDKSAAKSIKAYLLSSDATEVFGKHGYEAIINDDT